MEKIFEQGLLFDFYGPLLTAHQQEIYELVVYDNMSLGEIASQTGVSRQAVHDIVKRCDKILKDYEEKLGLIQRFVKSKSDIEEIKSILKSIKSEECNSSKIKSNIDECLRIAEELTDNI